MSAATTVGAAAAAVARGTVTCVRVATRTMLAVPAVAYPFAGYLWWYRAGWFGVSVSHPYFGAVTGGEVFYLLAFTLALGDVFRVSKPGVDNTWEALAVLMVGVVGVIVAALAAAGTTLFLFAGDSHWWGITWVAFITGILSLLVNARTLKRTIDMGAGG